MLSNVCLNPYSIGRYSVRKYIDMFETKRESLNPYSIGRYSVSVAER